ncbi:MAG TPA: hypothetical protein VMH81_32615 [Bryobacteraceae bacterium]|nr:hypothetical protein [Bryobacteraceae bacterium]
MRTLCFLGVLVIVVGATSCSSGPRPPAPGTPAFFWAAAQEAYRNGDYPQTDRSLSELVRSDNDYSVRARAWQLVISAGLAQGYSEMADNYEAGAKMNRENPMPFRKQVSTLRSLANAADMELAETFHGFLQKDKDPKVALAFAYPAGSVAPSAALKKVAAGMIILDSERDAMQTDMLQRGVLLSLSRAAGNADDPAKTLEKFKAGDVTVAREVFLFAMAKSLFDQSELYGSKRLDLPERLKVMLQEALDALHEVPQTKESKALTTKLEAAIKKAKST